MVVLDLWFDFWIDLFMSNLPVFAQLSIIQFDVWNSVVQVSDIWHDIDFGIFAVVFVDLMHRLSACFMFWRADLANVFVDLMPWFDTCFDVGRFFVQLSAVRYEIVFGFVGFIVCIAVACAQLSLFGMSCFITLDPLPVPDLSINGSLAQPYVVWNKIKVDMLLLSDDWHESDINILTHVCLDFMYLLDVCFGFMLALCAARAFFAAPVGRDVQIK